MCKLPDGSIGGFPIEAPSSSPAQVCVRLGLALLGCRRGAQAGFWFLRLEHMRDHRSVTSGRVVAVDRPDRRGSRRAGFALAYSVLIAGLLLVLFTSMQIGLGAGDRLQSLWALGLLAVIIGLGLHRAVRLRSTSPLAFCVGALLAAEGIAVGWLGHLHGYVQTPFGLALCVAAAVATFPSRGARAATMLALTAAAAVLLLAAAIGILGQYLTFSTNAGGFDCLSGFAGDPSQYPDAPAQPSGVTSSFSWMPLGRACTYNASAGAVTRVQTSTVTSAWIWGTAAVGLLLGVARALLAGSRRTPLL